MNTVTAAHQNLGFRLGRALWMGLYLVCLALGPFLKIGCWLVSRVAVLTLLACLIGAYHNPRVIAEFALFALVGCTLPVMHTWLLVALLRKC
jgi:hypothetical protein